MHGPSLASPCAAGLSILIAHHHVPALGFPPCRWCIVKPDPPCAHDVTGPPEDLPADARTCSSWSKAAPSTASSLMPQASRSRSSSFSLRSAISCVSVAGLKNNQPMSKALSHGEWFPQNQKTRRLLQPLQLLQQLELRNVICLCHRFAFFHTRSDSCRTQACHLHIC